MSLLTDLEDGHDGCREGVKVRGCVVLKDEPVEAGERRWFICFILEIWPPPLTLQLSYVLVCARSFHGDIFERDSESQIVFYENRNKQQA